MSKPDGKKASQSRISARARLRPKAQLTLPDEIRRALNVSEGDEIEFAVHEDGTITVRGYVSVPTDQARYFTSERHGGKQQIDLENAAGSGGMHGSSEATSTYLDALGAADQLWQRLRRFPGSSRVGGNSPVNNRRRSVKLFLKPSSRI